MKRMLLMALMALGAAACEKGFSAVDDQPADDVRLLPHDMIVLGSKLEDPYTVANMTRALDALYPTRARQEPLRPTHLYVRFLPHDRSEYDRLEEMGVELFDHPLDYEIVREGDYYHDPDVRTGDITWQYAVVDEGFVFPANIIYELLDECYIADALKPTRAADGIDWELVERESYRLTGNADRLPERTRDGETSAIPFGRITIRDEQYDSEPVGVAGVRVSCNSFVKVDHAFTDEGGYYVMDKSFSSKVRYRLIFKNRKGFGIGFNLILIPASSSTLGRQDPGGLDVTVDRNSDRSLFARCVVNNAGYDYFNSCSVNSQKMKAPPANLRIWIFHNLAASSAVMLQQGALIDRSVIGEYLGEYTTLLKAFLPDVTLGLRNATDYASIYAVAIHELAHASHFAQVGTDYWGPYIRFILKSYVSSSGITYGVGTEADHGYCEVGEMWAYYLQTRLYRERYPESNAVFGTSYWFSPQILLYMDDRGLDRFRLFQAFTSEVRDRDALEQKLLSLYPEQRAIITQAFARYN